VNLGFLDFSTRQRREESCRRETRLNQRLAPDVYLGVATVTDPEGEPCESLVVMPRMPDDRGLSTLVTSGVRCETAPASAGPGHRRVSRDGA
jgi:hypothetical protein